MSNLGERLREERQRLGMNQAELGSAGGVQKQAQLKYEKGERSPDASYLEAIARAGVDVLYVLTGSRSFAPPAPIAPEHRALVADYDACSVADQAVIRRTAAAMAHRGGDVAQSTRSVNQHVSGGKVINKKFKLSMGDKK